LQWRIQDKQFRLALGHYALVLALEETEFGLFGFGDLINRESLSFLPVKLGGQVVAEVSHFLIEIYDFEELSDLFPVLGLFLFFLGFNQKLLLREFFVDKLLFQRWDPGFLDTLDGLRDNEVAFGNCRRTS
jgi:hypothetical protein